MSLSPELLAVLVCPRCRGDLEYREAESSLICPRCALRYPVRDDIPVMLVDEAHTVDEAEHQRLLAKAEAQGLAPTFEAPPA